MMDEMCPDDMVAVCPTAQVQTRKVQNRMTGQDSCQCVPDFLLALVAGMPGMPAASRQGSIDEDKIPAIIKVGKKKCKCTFDMKVKGTSCKGSKGSCDKKCSGAAKGVELEDYVMDLKVTKGKVAISKCDVVGGSGSEPLPPTGSGSEPLPPTGSGSGPLPPTGSGSGPLPPTGLGSGPVHNMEAPKCACVTITVELIYPV